MWLTDNCFHKVLSLCFEIEGSSHIRQPSGSAAAVRWSLCGSSRQRPRLRYTAEKMKRFITGWRQLLLWRCEAFNNTPSLRWGSLLVLWQPLS